MIIKGGLVLIEDSFIKTDILVENGIISAIGPNISASLPTGRNTQCQDMPRSAAALSDAAGTESLCQDTPCPERPEQNASKPALGTEIIDAQGMYVIPGLIDIHFHGCMNHDFSGGSVKDIEALAEYEAAHGITGICPASMTLPEAQIRKICAAAAEYVHSYEGIHSVKDVSSAEVIRSAEGLHSSEGTLKYDDNCEFRADFLGIHLEGPFISETKKGAQNPEYIVRADKALFDSWQEAADGLIKIISVAPEYPENLNFIEEVSGLVRVSAAHTCSDYETAREAFTRGASHVTHLFNAMSPFSHRSPGLIGAASDACAEAEIICDGNHVHPSAIRAAFRLFGEEKIIFVSDSMEAAGMPDGRYFLGGLPVQKKGSRAVLEDGTIAGSVTNLFDCMRYAVKEAGIPLETAVRCSSENPAKSIDVFDTCGSISEGKAANLLLVDSEIRLRSVILHGRVKAVLDAKG